MIRDSKKIIKRLETEGWTEARTKGSHKTFKHPAFDHVITVPHPKELKTGLARAIAKAAGWE